MTTRTAAILTALLTMSVSATPQDNLEPADIRVRVLNCKNGRPVRGRKVELGVTYRPNFYERLEGRTNSQGIMAFDIKNASTIKVRSDVTDADWGYHLEGTRQEVVDSGLVADYCRKSNHVTFVKTPGELTFYIHPLNALQGFWSKYLTP